MRKQKKKEQAKTSIAVPQTAANKSFGWAGVENESETPQSRLYYALRENVPVLDAAISKLVRLTGDFTVCCSDKNAQRAIERFARCVPVSGHQIGLSAFVASYFDQLLTCGTAVGEIVTDEDGQATAPPPRDLCPATTLSGWIAWRLW